MPRSAQTQSPQETRDALASLSGTDRLSSDFVKNGIINQYSPPSTVKNAQTTPPVSPTAGLTYLVTSVATGAWSGKEKNVSRWDGSAWYFWEPFEGFSIRNENSGQWLVYVSSAWTTMSTDMLPEGSTNLYGVNDVNDNLKLGEGAGTSYNPATCLGNICIGKDANITAPASGGVAIGSGAVVNYNYGVAIGWQASACKASPAQQFGVAVGELSNAEGAYSVALGLGATATGEGAFAMGAGSSATGSKSMALGPNASTSVANMCRIGGTSTNKLDVEIDSTAYFYLGDSATNGSWRFYVSTNDLVFERRESGSWTEKGRFIA